MLLFICLFLICIFVICLFVFPKLSPIPYFPTNKKDLSLIMKAFNLRNNQTVFDLGAGDGVVTFEATNQAFKKKLNTKFIAVEINPVLVLILHIRRLFHPNRKNIMIVWGDLFNINYKNIMYGQNIVLSLQRNITIDLYVSPWLLYKIAKKILHDFPKAKIISYMYPIKSLKRREKIIYGKNAIFVYD